MNNEILFWKVIHNQYLFRKILHTIEIVEWVEYKNIESFNKTSRSKFKYIYSLEWMIQHGQFQLLKCKLLNDQEFVEIDNNGTKQLLSLNFSSGNDNDNTNKTESTSPTSTTTSVIDIKLFKEILQLIIKRLKLQSSPITTSTLVSTSFECSSLQVINLIFEYLNDGTTLESTIRNVYNNKKEEGKHQFNLYFKSAISNKNENHIFLDTVLDIISKEQQQQDIQNLEIKEFLEIGNTNIQNRLSDLDLLEINEQITGTTYVHFSQLMVGHISYINKGEGTKISDIIESMLIAFRIIHKLHGQPQQQHSIKQQLLEYQQQGSDNSLFVKELFKQFIILSKSLTFFRYYLSKYDQVIMELVSIEKFHLMALRYSFENFIPDLFKQQDYKLDSQLFHILSYEYKRKDKPFVSANLARSIEFLILYLSKLSILTSNNNLPQKVSETITRITINIIYDIVFEITDPVQYEQLVNNEIPECYKKFIPLKWNPIITQHDNRKPFILTNDTETIGWIKEWCTKRLEKIDDSFYNSFDQFFYNSLSFKTLELAEYASNQLSFFGNLDKSDFYLIPFLVAILKSDFQTIKYIHSLGTTFERYLFGNGYFNDILPITDNGEIIVVNYLEFNQIIEYIIEHQMLSEESIFGLIGFVAEHGYYNDNGNKDGNGDCKSLVQYDLGQIKFNLKIFDQQNTIEILERQCRNCNLFRFLLENIKFTYQDLQLNSSSDGFNFNDNSDKDKTNLIISLIKLVIDQLKQCREIIYLSSGGGSGTTTSDQLPNLQIYNSILNLLFNSFSIYNSNLEQFKQVYQMYIENQVELVTSDDIKSGYIKCRFPILDKYFSSLSLYDVVLPFPSFELFTLSFDQLLEIVIYRPPYQNEINNQEDKWIIYDIEVTLMFLIYIKRIDLFLKEWKLIKSDYVVKVLSKSKELIRSCCINLELNSIIEILDKIGDNMEILYEFCIVSLKLGILDVCKLAFTYLPILSKQHQNSKYSKFIQLMDQNNLNRNSLINILNK